MASILDGKTIIALGDSLIHGSKLGNQVTWVNKLAAMHGMTLYNHGINGNSIALPEGEHKHPPMCVRYADMEPQADYIVVLGGANDKRLDIPLGDPTRRLSTEYRDVTTFYGALHTLIAGLTEKYPRAKLLMMTNYDRWRSKNKLGMSDIEYVDAMLEVSALWAIPCFDNYRKSGISFQNPAQLPWIDEGVAMGDKPNHHFSDEAYTWLIPKYEKLLESL